MKLWNGLIYRNGITLLGGKLEVGHGYAGATNTIIGQLSLKRMRTISWAGGRLLNYIRLDAAAQI